jgi:hypothetical protein
MVVYRNLEPETEARLLAASPVVRNSEPETEARRLAASPVFRDPESEPELEASLQADCPGSSSSRIRNTKNTYNTLKDHILHTNMIYTA